MYILSSLSEEHFFKLATELYQKLIPTILTSILPDSSNSTGMDGKDRKCYKNSQNQLLNFMEIVLCIIYFTYPSNDIL